MPTHLNNDWYIRRFVDEYAFLSNFYPAEFEWNGIVWQTAEHAYQAMKCASKDEFKIIREASHPALAKKLGRVCNVRPDWNKIKFMVMRNVVHCKFNQNPKLQKLLIETGDKVIIEGNWHHDNIWGCCPPDTLNGLNLLGKILMEYRTEMMLFGTAIEPDNVNPYFTQNGISPRMKSFMENI